MSATSGPDIVSDSLVFYYDTGNSRDSYKGEPTENLIPNPYYVDESGNPTVSGYGTFGFGHDNTLAGTTTPSAVGNGYSARVIKNTTTNGTIVETVAIPALNTGDTVVVSWYAKGYGGSENQTCQTHCYVNSSEGAISTGTYSTVTSEWKRFYHIFTWTKSAQSYTSANSYFYSGFGTGTEFLVSNPQVEVYKAHPTQFVNGTRSSTQGLLDISGQGTSIDLSNVSFDSNAQMTFDGTDDKLHGIQTVHSYLSSSAIEFIVSPETSNKRMMVGGYRHNGGYSLPTIGSVYIDSDNKFKASVITTTEVYRFVASSTTINANQTYHVIFNKNTSDGNMELYVNGILQSSQTFDSATYAQWASAGNYIGSDNIDLGKSFNTNSGQGWSGDYLEGKIHIFKIHSRILTAAEVKQNYDSIKTRFGLT